jgi:biopolymer transport protein TolR
MGAGLQVGGALGGRRARRRSARPMAEINVTPMVDVMLVLLETELSLDEIAPKLTAISKNGFEERIFVRGDRRVDYGQIMKVMATINAAGFRRIALISDLEDKP